MDRLRTLAIIAVLGGIILLALSPEIMLLLCVEETNCRSIDGDPMSPGWVECDCERYFWEDKSPSTDAR